MKDHETHLTHYLILVIGLLFFGVAFLYFSYDEHVQVFLAITVSLFYALWGIIHHAVEARLTRFIALEYVLFGSVIFFLLLSAIGL